MTTYISHLGHRKLQYGTVLSNTGHENNLAKLHRNKHGSYISSSVLEKFQVWISHVIVTSTDDYVI